MAKTTAGRNQSKRILACGDFHCGSVCGLTPPHWQIRHDDCSTTKRNKFAALQAELWDYFVNERKTLGPIDIAILNGDLIDGRGKDKAMGTEHFTSDRQEQCDIAVWIIKHVIKPKHCIITKGTTFHVGADGEDFENLIAQRVGAEKIGAHEWLDVNGVVFDCKHHLGSSSIPHGRYTAAARDALWNTLWAVRGEQPKASVIIRSHVHYFTACTDGRILAMTLPALQGIGTKYGSLRCSGTVDFGFVHFDVDAKGRYVWQAHLAEIAAQKAQALSL